MDLDLLYPSLSDLRAKAKKRLPKFAFEYLDSGTGTERGMHTNRAALDAVQFLPAILQGPITADLTTSFMGKTYDLPVGIAPIGMSGMIWPGAERKLAQVAVEKNIPYGLSTVATARPEQVGPHAGENGWFQLYPPVDPEIRRDMLKRARAAGFRKIALTVDVPGESRRERQRRAHISLPPKLTPSMLYSMITHPTWSLLTAKEGRPSIKLLEDYLPKNTSAKNKFLPAAQVIRGYPDWDYLAELRDEWDGDLIIKGVQSPDDALRLKNAGVDGVWVSNHSARQFEAGPASITQLPLIREAVGPDFPLIFDSGVTSGLDVLRALSLGADFVMMGRAFHYAMAALGQKGARHMVHIIDSDLRANMAQLGARNFAEVKDRLI